MIGQIVQQITPEVYLVQPFEADGTPSEGQVLVHLASMVDGSMLYAYRFYETIAAALEATHAFPQGKPKPAEKPIERPGRTTLQREPRELAEPAAPPPTAAATSPATKPHDSPATAEVQEDPEAALASLEALVGEHGIMRIARETTAGNKVTALVVEVNGDTSDAAAVVPDEAFGVKVKIVSVKPALANGPSGKAAEAAPKDDRPF